MKWRSVETPPLEPDANIVYEQATYIVTDGERVTTCEFARGNGVGKPWAEWSQYGDMSPQEITHWMPLPPPPTDTAAT